MAKRLLNEGHTVIVIDSLEKGNKQAVPEGAIFEEGNLLDQTFLSRVFSSHTFDAVFHFAAYISVGESVREPLKYYANNIGSTVALLTEMKNRGCTKFIFSSTAAVYGTPDHTPIPESHRLNPESPYGRSKLMIEQLLPDIRDAFGIDYVVLRYFNASGASLDGSMGESHTPETHMIPNALFAALEKRPFRLYGTDYETPDGTCVRDYIHILDLVEAHVSALKKINEEQGGYTYNVGTGNGFSNKQVIEEVKHVTGADLEVISEKRRSGDPSVLIADPTKINRELGFSPKYSDLSTIVSSAWQWHKARRHEEQ